MKNSILFALAVLAFSTASSAQITLALAVYDSCSTTDNDPDGNVPLVRARHAMLWKSAAYFDPACQSNDLSEGVKRLAIQAQSPCGTATLTARFELFLDLTGDGVLETTVDSDNPTLRFALAEELVAPDGSSSSLLPSISGSHDAPVLTVAAGQTATPAQIAAAAQKRFFVARDPEWDAAFPLAGDRFLKDIDLPLGRHRIRWTIADGCGDSQSVELNFAVVDCKKPTIICQPLNGPMMNGPQSTVTVWATDWVEYADDNAGCPTNWYSVRKAGAAGFGSGIVPLTAGGGPVTSVIFDCNDGNMTNGLVQVEVWTRDVQGNYDYCVSQIQLNKQGCNGTPPPQNVVEARTMPLFGSQCITSLSWKVSGSTPGLPAPVLMGNGCQLDLSGLPIGNGFVFAPQKDINPTNGVSVFDLVLISKHILGAEPFDSPYKWIAADINHSGSVTTADIVELRKVVLGILSDFPANDSWRFVRSAYTFTSTNPAGEAFPEAITFGQAMTAENDFVGMKIGDLNGNAIPSGFWDEKADDRSPLEPFQIAVEDRFFEKGELFEVLFSLEKNESEASAFQFSLEHDGLEIVEILAEKGLPTDHFGLFKSEKLLTASWIETDGEPVFGLKMRAEKAGRLADFLKISDRKTRSEGYSSDGQSRLLQLKFQAEKPAPNSFSGAEKTGLQLFPAEPNPFDESTRIRFFSTEKEVVATVFDAAGRIVFSKKLDVEKGETSFSLFKNDLKSAGFYLLKIETPSGSATQKLILER